MFYPKMAWDNIRKNSRTYLPFILTCIFTAAMDYVICALTYNEGLSGIYGASVVALILNMGTYVTALFTVIFLFYTNSFLIKRRKKEFGLYNILGMSKRHIARLIAIETLYTFLISTVCGILIGMLLDKLMYLIISKLIGVEITLGFYISIEGIKYTVILFAVVFFLIFLNSLRQIHLSKPVELLHGGKVGEKEPKANRFIALLGVACLGTGYYIAITTKNPITAINLFFVAVILVIIGTYLVFTAGSIALLKLLRKNKRYYYKPKHFISVSGMIYRMKQNAVGLANICVLSTMVLVMISSTFSLVMGIDDTIAKTYPHEINTSTDLVTSDDMLSYMREMSENAAKNQGTRVTNSSGFRYLAYSVIDEGGSLTVTNAGDIKKAERLKVLAVIPLSDYNQNMNTDYSLSENEVLLSGAYDKNNLSVGGEIKVTDIAFRIKESADGMEIARMVSAGVDTVQMIVSDFSVVERLYKIQADIYGEKASSISAYYGFDIENSDKQNEVKKALQAGTDSFYADYFKNNNKEDIIVYHNISVRDEQKAGLMELYGGLLFLGAFLGLMFTIAAVLIIYYKQMSEGYDDRDRFEIMQKVGLSEKETKSAIHSQVLTVFFLPLIMAGVHIAFAFPMIKRMLSMLMLDNLSLFLVCVIACFVIFSALYMVIYGITAKVYYKIVKAT